MTAQEIDPAFQHTGTWYDFFTGDSITVSDSHAALPLNPGEFHIFTDMWVTPPDTGLLFIDDRPAAALPTTFTLYQNYPNPFNPGTSIRFDLPQAFDVVLMIYDLLGREVVRLVDGPMERGYHQIIWGGRDRAGREVPTGIYFARLLVPPTLGVPATGSPAGVAPAYTKSIKMLLLK